MSKDTTKHLIIKMSKEEHSMIKSQAAIARQPMKGFILTLVENYVKENK